MITNTSNNLDKAKNIGTKIKHRLHQIGIFSIADLAERTPEKAFQEIRDMHPNDTIPVCYYLFSLKGALINLHWNDLPKELKKELLAEVA